jgi:hypothetical protein
MNIISNPLHCTLVFDFSVNEKNFTVSFYQDLITNDKTVTVSNPDGTDVEDRDLCDLIGRYAIEKYSITYDPGDEETEEVHLDPPI